MIPSVAVLVMPVTPSHVRKTCGIFRAMMMRFHHIAGSIALITLVVFGAGAGWQTGSTPAGPSISASPARPEIAASPGTSADPPTPTSSAPASRPSVPGPQRLDSETAEVLRIWSDTLKATVRFSVELESDVRISGVDHATEVRSAYLLTVERPNRIALRPTTPEVDPALYCDGSHVFAFLPIAREYTRELAPQSFEHLLTGNAARVLLAGGSGLAHLPLILADDPFDNLTMLATAGSYLGVETVAGVPCHHLQLVQRFFRFDMWLETGPQALLRKLVPAIIESAPSTSVAGGSTPAGRVQLETTLTFSKWSLQPAVRAETFAFIPPAGARQVKDLLIGSGREEPDPLVGRAAPSFTMTLLDGSTFDLAAHKSQDVVVLDFWASWSSGSAERLPILDRLTKRYADRPVTFLAINVDDLERFAKSFLSSRGVTIPVGLDRDGAVARTFGVRKLPHTVLVGPDGIVRAVYGPTSGEISGRLRSDIDNLLEGKGLGSTTRPEDILAPSSLPGDRGSGPG